MRSVVLTIPPGGYSAEIPVRDEPRNGRCPAEARTAEGGVSRAGQPGAAEGTPDEYSENGR